MIYTLILWVTNLCFWISLFGENETNEKCGQRIYENGGRKFEIAGVGAIGCCPAYRVKNNTECVSEVNDWALKYNEALKSMLQEWQSQNPGITYSYFDTFAAFNDLIHNPSSYGIFYFIIFFNATPYVYVYVKRQRDEVLKGIYIIFVTGFAQVKAACCGLGELRAKIPCLLVSNFCSNREDHIFWDQYHPTQAASRIFVDRIFNGPSKYTFPITMRQLLSVWTLNSESELTI